jgi:hypothetical protein
VLSVQQIVGVALIVWAVYQKQSIERDDDTSDDLHPGIIDDDLHYIHSGGSGGTNYDGADRDGADHAHRPSLRKATGAQPVV